MESALGGSQFTFMEYWLSVQWRYINLNNICKVRCQFAKRVSSNSGQQGSAPARPVLPLRRLSCSVQCFHYNRNQCKMLATYEAQSGASASAALLEHTILLDHLLGLRTSLLRQGEVTYSFSFVNFFTLVVEGSVFPVWGGYLLPITGCVVINFFVLTGRHSRTAPGWQSSLHSGVSPVFVGTRVGIYYRLPGGVCRRHRCSNKNPIDP